MYLLTVTSIKSAVLSCLPCMPRRSSQEAKSPLLFSVHPFSPTNLLVHSDAIVITDTFCVDLKI